MCRASIVAGQQIREQVPSSSSSLVVRIVVVKRVGVVTYETVGHAAQSPGGASTDKINTAGYLGASSTDPVTVARLCLAAEELGGCWSVIAHPDQVSHACCCWVHGAVPCQPAPRRKTAESASSGSEGYSVCSCRLQRTPSMTYAAPVREVPACHTVLPLCPISPSLPPSPDPLRANTTLPFFCCVPFSHPGPVTAP